MKAQVGMWLAEGHLASQPQSKDMKLVLPPSNTPVELKSLQQPPPSTGDDGLIMAL